MTDGRYLLISPITERTVQMKGVVFLATNKLGKIVFIP